jgi:hypothetical protein
MGRAAGRLSLLALILVSYGVSSAAAMDNATCAEKKDPSNDKCDPHFADLR